MKEDTKTTFSDFLLYKKTHKLSNSVP